MFILTGDFCESHSKSISTGFQGINDQDIHVCQMVVEYLRIIALFSVSSIDNKILK